MTVREAATLYGLTRQSVYARLRGRVDPVTDKAGQMTEDALEAMKELYGEPDSQNTVKDRQEQSKTDKSVKELTDQLKAAQDQAESYSQACEVLQVKVDSLTERVKELTGERDYLRSMLDKSMTLALPSGDQERKLTFWERLTGKRKQPEQKKPEA